MIDFYEKENWDRTVYYIEDLTIRSSKLSDLCLDFCEKTTSPRGVEPKIHCEKRTLYSWNIDGSKEIVMEFESEAQAKHAEMLCHRYDLYNNDQIFIYNNEKDAIGDLKELTEDNT